MNETTVKRKSYGDQPGRGASEATISQGRIKKGICEPSEAIPDTSNHVVQDGHGWSPAKYMTI